MKHLTLKLTTLILIISIIVGCKKNDLINAVSSSSQDEVSTPKGLDYSKVTSAYLFDASGNEIPLFNKFYIDRNTNKLTSIDAAFWSVVSGLSYLNHYNIYYHPRQIIVQKPGMPDTAAILNFNSSGRLINAVAYPVITEENKREFFKFKYSSGKLYEITAAPYNSKTRVDTLSYIRLHYDAGMKNVSKVLFSPGSPSSTHGSITYKYDYSITNLQQFYADEGYKDYWQFWYFLKYLNIFPELLSQNLLVQSYLKDDQYPGEIKKRFTKQLFYATGNLAKYQLIEIYPALKLSPHGTWWNVSWRKAAN